MQHSKAIRELAVARIRANAAPLLELAKEYGVSTNTLRAWLRESNLRQRAQEDARRVAATLAEPGEEGNATQRDRLLIHAIEHSPATIIVTDAEGRIVYANPKFAETTGYAIGEAIGKNPRLLKSGVTSPADYRKLWKTILSGNEWRGNFRNRRKDGSLYWERASISPVFGDAGRITHFMAVKEDVTELMESEITSRRQVATYRAMFDALPTPVMLVDRDDLILHANPAAEDLCHAHIPSGSPFRELNLRWIDRDGRPVTAEEHPLARLRTDPAAAADESMIGVIPPTGGARWVKAAVRRIDLPAPLAPAFLLCLLFQATAASR